jgi:hypothetical protein
METQTERVTVKTAALATLTTGVVMVDKFEGVGEAAEAVTGHPVWTHEMGKAADRAREVIPAQLPGFPMEATSENWQQVRDAAIAQFGETVEIERGTNQRRADPMTTLVETVAELRK